MNVFLTKDQIDAVIDWMNNWDQLKDSAIPMRFEQDWIEQLEFNTNHNTVKPPIGLKPKWIHDQQRQGEIIRAMTRYFEAGIQKPKKNTFLLL